MEKFKMFSFKIKELFQSWAIQEYHEALIIKITKIVLLYKLPITNLVKYLGM